jgi:secondary thiamine-phosphate synthase enzyme
METREVGVGTGDRPAVVDLTGQATAFLEEVAGGRDGLLHVHVPHATCGVVLMELGSGSEADLLDALERLLPHEEGRWRHRHGSAGHGADHVLPLVVPASLSLPVLSGRAALGTWQSIALVDPNRDNPTRRVRLSFLPG